MIKSIFIFFIKLYRYAISYLLGNCCRFEPTCSQYAIVAMQEAGVFRGCFLSMKRILKCHPWHEGGYDPVSVTSKNRK